MTFATAKCSDAHTPFQPNHQEISDSHTVNAQYRAIAPDWSASPNLRAPVNARRSKFPFACYPGVTWQESCLVSGDKRGCEARIQVRQVLVKGSTLELPSQIGATIRRWQVAARDVDLAHRPLFPNQHLAE
jgi:hypothetical protein